MYTFLVMAGFAGLLLWMTYDRIRSTFTKRVYQSVPIPASEYLLAGVMTTIYLAIVFLSLYHLFQSLEYAYCYLFVSFGVVLFFVGRQIRNTAIHTLGKNWNISTSATNVKRIIHIGPYKYSRHPYYWATWLELLGFVLAGRSWPAFLLFAIIYVPMTMYRIKREEKDLTKKFSDQYIKYKVETSILFSWGEFLKCEVSNLPIIQVYRLLTQYGLRHILVMKYVHSNIIKYGRGYMLSCCMGALFDVGFVEELEEKGEVDLNNFAQRNRLSVYYLRAICDYLFILGILNRQGQHYFLSGKGMQMVKEAKGVFSLIYAYSPLFEELVPLLKEEKRYGQDVQRRGKYVAKGSAEMASYLPFPEARKMIERYRVKRILDLGCGSADFLISTCSKGDFLGMGIDISEDAIEYARERVAKTGLNGRIKLSVGDIFNLGVLPEEFKSAELITSMFVLHEFLYEGIQKVSTILEQIKIAFPNRYLLILELCRRTPEDLRYKPSGIAEHHLFHALSKQGFASFELWKRIFRASRLALVEERRFDFSEQGYFLLRT